MYNNLTKNDLDNLLKIKTSMNFYSKEVLTDTFGRFHNYLRISLTERCNLRCTYCMPENGIELTENEKLMKKEELIKLVKIFVKLGVNKIRLTGGEPLVNPQIVETIEEIKKNKEIKSIGITTNGLTLKHKLSKLKEAGLTHINISLDTLVEAKFNFISRREGLEKIKENIFQALNMGFEKVKINCVLMKGVNDDEIDDFVKMTKNHNLEVRFIEFMPFSENKWSVKKMIKNEDVLNDLKKRYEIESADEDKSQPSSDYKVKNFKGKIGFISSMTDKFCSDCNRIRLTADGNLKVCLFGREETNLINLLRENKSESEIIKVISDAVKRKKASHDGMFEIEKSSLESGISANRPMIKIGG